MTNEPTFDKAARRVELVSDTLPPELDGLKGWSLAPVAYALPDGGTVPGYRVALDNGRVDDFPSIVLNVIPADMTDELTRPALEPIQTPDEQEKATKTLARIHNVMETNRAKILEVEARIKQEQAEVAARIRGTYPELYESQRITALLYAEHEARLQVGAETLWFAAGCPDKGKTYGAAQIADDWQITQFDPQKAFDWAKTQVPNLISEVLDIDAFKKAVVHGKVGTLKNVPADVCKWEKGYKVKTLTTVLKTQAE